MSEHMAEKVDTRCRSTFDDLGPNPRPTDLRGTHTCEEVQGHTPPHVCPRCGARWVREVSPPPGEAIL